MEDWGATTEQVFAFEHIPAPEADWDEEWCDFFSPDYEG